VKLRSRVPTALNLLPSIATSACENSFSSRHSVTKRRHTFRIPAVVTTEVNYPLEVRRQATREPHQFDVALAFPFQAAARLNPDFADPDANTWTLQEHSLSWQQGPLSSGAIGRFLVPDPLPTRLLFVEPLSRHLVVRHGEHDWFRGRLAMVPSRSTCPRKGTFLSAAPSRLGTSLICERKSVRPFCGRAALAAALSIENGHAPIGGKSGEIGPQMEQQSHAYRTEPEARGDDRDQHGNRETRQDDERSVPRRTGT
jgi:hypothetical protein